MANTDPKEEDIFAMAVQLEPDERQAYLIEACNGDAQLEARIQALLKADEQADDFLEPPNDSEFMIGRAIQRAAPCDEMPGDFIGRYKLLEIIGEGGWGVIWMAEQKEPVRRRVALKILKLGMDTKEVVARFESERQALALMDHPHIAKVFDGGVAPSGRPFFVMELVKGRNINKYCDEEKLSSRKRLQLFIDVCHAVQHAHQKGIIHRDIKPSNILVTISDGEAIPKVIDFGIAKATQFDLTEKTLYTQFHSFVGTPAYTSPEQIQMSSIDVDTRSDIYSLGVLLYELISGTPPFDPNRLSQMGIDSIRKIISEEEPPTPSSSITALHQEDCRKIAAKRGVDALHFQKELKGELDWIAMKCLEKNRSQRYETVNALSLDIRRYLNKEPVLARQPTSLYKLKKLIDRNRIVFGTAIAIATILLFGSSLISYLGLRALKSERLAQNEVRKTAEISEFIKNMYSHVDSQVELQIKGPAHTQILKDTLRETIDLASLRLPNVSSDASIELCDILGSVYFRIQAYDSAAAMFRKERNQLQAMPKPPYAKLARAMNHLGAALGRQKILDEAEHVIREALNMHREYVEQPNPDLARTLVNLSVVQLKKAAKVDLSNEEREMQLQLAVKSIEEALYLQRDVLISPQAEIAASLNELGFILTCQGGEKLDKAETVLKEALAMNRNSLGDISPAVASSMNLLAITEVIKGKYMNAVNRYREVQSIRKKLEETTVKDLTSSYDVSVWEHQNTGEESLEALHDVVTFAKYKFAPNSQEVADFLAIQAWVYNAERQFENGLEKAEECLKIRETGGAPAWSIHNAQSLIGCALLGQGKFDEAEGYLLQGYNGIKANKDALTEEHKIRLPESLYYLLQLYNAWGKPEERKKWLLDGESIGVDLSVLKN